MSRKVVLSPTARKKLDDLLDYLDENWPRKVKKDFINKLDITLKRICKYPESCPESKEIKRLRKCVVTSQNSLFYRIGENEIEVITFFDNRQDPSKLKR